METKTKRPGVVMHAFNACTQGTEAGRADLGEFKGSLVYIGAPGQPELHSETLF